MAKSANSAASGNTVKTTTLVDLIMRALKLDDAGKLTKFFSQLQKDANTEIKKLVANQKTDILQHEIALDELDQKIEDAKESVDDAYKNVTVDGVKNNASIDAFKGQYWAGVTAAENALQSLIDQRETLVEDFDETNEESDAQIEKYKARIARIS